MTMTARQEIKHLQESLVMLQEQILQADAREKKAVNELNCFIKLVKQAWTGDSSAAIHVANIVGVAPPDLREEFNSDGISLTARPKPRPINNWARLTIGLLNAEYLKQEQILDAKQKMYLNKRNHYLNEQLQCEQHNTQVPRRVKRISSAPPMRQRHNSWSDLSDTRGDPSTAIYTQPLARQLNSRQDIGRTDTAMSNRPKMTNGLKSQSVNVKTNGKPPPPRRASGRHLYRHPATQTPRAEVIGDICWDDVVSHPLNKNTSAVNNAFSGLSKTMAPSVSGTCEIPSSRSESVFSEDVDRMYVEYDDPGRYMQGGLFDSQGVQKPSRPISAVQQRNSDRIRARPRSAVSEKGGRPLKYESTRPLSGTKSTTGSARAKQQTFMTDSPQDQSQDLPPHEEPSTTPTPPEATTPRVVYPTARDFHLHDLEAADVEPGPDSNRIPTHRLKPAESVVQFEKDLSSMSSLERELKQNTIELQRQLGISENGIVY